MNTVRNDNARTEPASPGWVLSFPSAPAVFDPPEKIPDPHEICNQVGFCAPKFTAVFVSSCLNVNL